MVVKKRSPSVADQILEALEERGHRSTAPRRALATAIGEQDRHFTAEGLRRQLPPRLGRATVYRTLKILVEAGVLCRVLLEDGDLHYQLSHRGHHHHLLCVQCGSSEDLTGCDIEEVLLTTSAQHGFELSGHWLEVYGRCRQCVLNEAPEA
jgi:Fur family ferric uptake transcriptional regulator